MNSFEKSAEFDEWLKALKDRAGKVRILHRLTAAEHGNFGDCEPVGGGVSEMRIHYGPGLFHSRWQEGLFPSDRRGQVFAKAGHKTRNRDGADNRKGWP
jgi:putative addiction module killer protein